MFGCSYKRYILYSFKTVLNIALNESNLISFRAALVFLYVYVSSLVGNVNFPEGVSLVVVCMNRQDTMKEVIKFWLDVKDIDEVILVDWNSDPPLQTITKKVKDPRFVLVRVNDEESWVLSRAYNIGMSMATR